MKLKTFIEKYKLSDSLTVDNIALQHPESKEKIYVISQWNAGFWYRKIKGSAGQNGQMWPAQFSKPLGELEVHKDAKKELDVNINFRH